MSKTETMKQSAAASNAMQLDLLTQQIEALRRAKIKSADQLAETLEPIAQAMAALTDQTAKTLAGIDVQTERASAAFEARMEKSISAWTAATQEAQSTLTVLQQATNRLDLRHYLMAIMTGILSALLVTALLSLVSPRPVIQTVLDVDEFKALLKADPKGSATAPQRQSPGK